MSHIICFGGMDGSGKSTLSQSLGKELKSRNISVTTIWWLECEDSFIRKSIRKINSINSEKTKENKTKQNSLKCEVNKMAYKIFPWIVLVDYLKFGLFNALIPKLIGKNEIIIFDRFFYDVIFALDGEFKFSKKTFNRIFYVFKKILPEPDIIFFIEVDPQISLQRKKDEIKTINNAKKIWKVHQNMQNQVIKSYPEKVEIINGNNSLNNLKNEILTKTLYLCE